MLQFITLSEHRKAVFLLLKGLLCLPLLTGTYITPFVFFITEMIGHIIVYCSYVFKGSQACLEYAPGSKWKHGNLLLMQFIKRAPFFSCKFYTLVVSLFLVGEFFSTSSFYSFPVVDLIKLCKRILDAASYMKLFLIRSRLINCQGSYART